MIDTALLSRIQFAFTISFHILFPTFSIGLVTFLAVMEGIWLATKNPKYLQICKFWTKIFALTFGMGIVSGIVMEFQFGTNWSGFAQRVGDVLGALFTYEVMTAFFIEAGFLGVMLFGWNRVGPRLHYFATLLVMIGTTLSAFWILSANSWMQTPSGVTNIANKLVVTNWIDVILNPSMISRFLHMLLASYISTGFVIAGISAYYILKKTHLEFAKTCFSFLMVVLVFLTAMQVFIGDEVGLMISKHQPLKTAAMEGLWQTQRGAPFLIFAFPDQKEQKNYFEIKIPHGAALINTHQWDGLLIGLSSVSREDQPFVPFVFYSFRLMVGLGLLMFLLALIGFIYQLRKTIYDKKWFLKTILWINPIGFFALWFGWITAETGRQPWAVYQMLRTSEAASPVAVANVIFSMILILVVYGIIFGFFYFYYFTKFIHKGPEVEEEPKILDQPFPYMSAGVKGGNNGNGGKRQG